MEPSLFQRKSADYAEAFRSVRLVKNLCWWAIALAIAVQLAGFCLVRFGDVIDAAPELNSEHGITITEQYEDDAVSGAKAWYEVLHWLLPGMKFLAFVAAALLVLTLLFAVKLSLLGRLGGVAGLISAFFWSLLLWAIITPWQQVLHGSFASGSLYNLGEMVSWTKMVESTWGAAGVPWYDHVLHYARFIAFPVVTLLVWLLVQLKFARGCRAMSIPPTVVSEEPAVTEP